MMTFEKLAGLTYKEYEPDDTIELTVLCTTYNHSEYISDTLDGFLRQITSFRFEVIVHDDASTDETADIIREYAEKYPDKIKAYLAPNNIFFHKDRARLLYEFWQRVCKGKYCTFCEGDDLWIDSNKLQIQYDYMETHPDCLLHLHNCIWIDYLKNRIFPGNPYATHNEKDITSEEAIMLYNAHPPTASFFFRKNLLWLPDMVLRAPMGDYSFMLFALYKGKIHYDSRIMSVYRYLTGNSFSMKVMTDSYRALYFNYNALIFLIEYDRYTDYRFHKWCYYREQTYAISIIENISSDSCIGLELIQCEEHDYIINYNKEVTACLDNLHRQLNSPTFIFDKTIEFVHKYKHIYIMGAGKYGTALAKQLNANGIEFEAFIVSETKDKDEHMGKKVKLLSDISKDPATGVLVGISPTKWKEIIECLKRDKVKNYYCPFLFEMSGN